MIVKNKTPYIGSINFKFEKNPYYTGNQNGILNKVHLNLGFTKLVSRIRPYRNKDGWTVNSECIELITKYTGGKVGTHTFHEGEHQLPNSFMASDGTYIGDIERGWWYYNNKLYVCQEYPNGAALKLKTYTPNIRLKNYILDEYENFVTEQIENDNIEGYYGYTHRGGSLFKIGDRFFDNYYLPTKSDYTEEEWENFHKNYQKLLAKSDENEKKWIVSEGIASVIPFNKRGKKVITNWREARQAAISLSKYLS